MTPAEKRIKDLVGRWLSSLDLHLQYTDLNDLAYNRVQNWPVHDRPAKPILEIAQQKTQELSAILRARQAAGDVKFAEAIELVNFLTNLVGSQYVQRFIPIAEAPPQAEATRTAVKTSVTPAVTASSKTVAPPAGNSVTVKMPPQPRPTPAAAPLQSAQARTAPKPAPIASKPVTKAGGVIPDLDDSLILAARIEATTRIQPPAPAPRAVAVSRVDIDATREMPQVQKNPAAIRKAVAAKPIPPKPNPARPNPLGPNPIRPTANNKPTAPQANVKPTSGQPLSMEQLIITDAVRLINWGRQWHELAEAIGRIADRPTSGEIRKILRNHRDEIQRRAAEPQT